MVRYQLEGTILGVIVRSMVTKKKKRTKIFSQKRCLRKSIRKQARGEFLRK